MTDNRSLTTIQHLNAWHSCRSRSRAKISPWCTVGLRHEASLGATAAARNGTPLSLRRLSRGSGLDPHTQTLRQQPWSGWEGRTSGVSRSQVCTAPEQTNTRQFIRRHLPAWNSALPKTLHVLHATTKRTRASARVTRCHQRIHNVDSSVVTLKDRKASDQANCCSLAPHPAPEGEREREFTPLPRREREFTPFQLHRADAGAARTSPGTSGRYHNRVFSHCVEQQN